MYAPLSSKRSYSQLPNLATNNRNLENFCVDRSLLSTPGSCSPFTSDFGIRVYLGTYELVASGNGYVLKSKFLGPTRTRVKEEFGRAPGWNLEPSNIDWCCSQETSQTVMN
jgi:hypothetical protein